MSKSFSRPRNTNTALRKYQIMSAVVSMCAYRIVVSSSAGLESHRPYRKAFKYQFRQVAHLFHGLSRWPELVVRCPPIGPSVGLALLDLPSENGLP